MGMLHDIGRFEQIRRYNTFSDADSIDHASLGADILFSDSLILKFGDFDERELRILELSIRNHSAYRINLFPCGSFEEFSPVVMVLSDL